MAPPPGSSDVVNWITSIPSRDRDGLLVVVDGGATHSRVAVVATDGTLHGFATGQPTNARSVGLQQAAANLGDTLHRALTEGSADADAVVFALVTSAAVDTLAQSDNLAGAVRRRVPGVVAFGVPDTMGCWAATNRLGPGVAVIAGTGSVVVAGDRRRGLWRRFGGWDFLLGDEGSGYSLGRAALQETLLVGEGRSGAQEMSARLLADPAARERGIERPDDIPDAVHTPIDKAWIASFARIVLDLADAGDPDALRLVRREVAILADAVAAGLDALDLDESGAHDVSTPVGLFGGTFNSAALLDAFTTAVSAATDRAFTAAVPPHTALVGAFAMAVSAAPDADPAEVAAAADRLAAQLEGRPGT